MSGNKKALYPSHSHSSPKRISKNRLSSIHISPKHASPELQEFSEYFSSDVSFYVPAFNAEKCIRKCIRSILLQENLPSEIILIDNCCTDNTAQEAMSEFIAFSEAHKAPSSSSFPEFPSFRIVKEKKKGISFARNRGIYEARFPLVASVDSDCAIEKQWLGKMVSALKDKRIAGAGGMLVENSAWRAVHLRQEWGGNAIKNPKFLFGSNTIFRKSDVVNSGSYNERCIFNYEDVDLSKRLYQNGFSLAYEPSAKAVHMKKESLFSMLKSAWAWGFYGNEPKGLLDLLKRCAFNIINPLAYMLSDIFALRFSLVLIDFLMLFSNFFFDCRQYAHILLRKSKKEMFCP